MKVAELQGIQLDYWVATAKGLKIDSASLMNDCVAVLVEGKWINFVPSADWAHAGPIIEYEKIELSYIDHECWYARMNPNAASPDGLQPHEGETALIAAMRAFVASKLGDEVQ